MCYHLGIRPLSQSEHFTVGQTRSLPLFFVFALPQVFVQPTSTSPPRSLGLAGCKHFSKANDYLRSKDCAPINWSSIME